MRRPKRRPNYLPVKLATLAMCASSLNAFAAGSVIKQTKCALIIEGISGLAKGQTLEVTPKGAASAKTKVKAAKGNKALLELESGRCSENFQGATAEAPSSSSNNASSGTQTAKSVGVVLQGGFSSANLNRKEGSASSIGYAGADMALELRYTLKASSKVNFPLALGGGWHTKGVILNNVVADQSEQYTQTWASPFARVGAGVQFGITNKIRAGGIGFFDYGFGGNLTQSGDSRSVKLPIARNMRYGLSAEADFAITPSIKAGASGNFFMGSLGLKEMDYSNSTDGVQVINSSSFVGFGGALKLAFEF